MNTHAPVTWTGERNNRIRGLYRRAGDNLDFAEDEINIPILHAYNWVDK